MLDLLSFALGSAVAAPLAYLLHARITQRQEVEAAPPAPSKAALSGPDRVEVELARRLLDETTRDLETLANGLGEELATMASAIEGHAQLLCEGLGDPQVIAVRADRLWTGVRRLRMFSEKILSFGQVDTLPIAPVDARSALDQIAQEIEETGSRLKVRVTSSGYLPPMLANERALRNAALFLVDTLLRIETRASRVELHAYAEVFDDQATRVRIEIWAEADESGTPHAPTDHAVHLGYIAARNLLEAQGARLAFDEVEGLSVACFLSFPTTQETAVLPEPVEPEVAETPHHYGGVLILESDPEVRSLIAHELQALGRKMVSCVDGASARSLLEATPDRFEMAVLSADARVEGGCSIAALAAERIDNVRILLLTTRPIAPGELPECGEVRVLQKPFGLQELRDTIRSMAGSATARL
jgi:CheY-like chemotaxis protein